MLAAPTLQKKIYTDCTLLENPRVRGSIPRLGTMNIKASQQCEAFLFLASGVLLQKITDP